MAEPALSVAALSRQIVDRKTGVIHRLAVLPRAGDQVRLTHIAARLPDLAQLPSCGAISDPCGGRQATDEALRQVLFECVERSCASFASHRQLVLARPYAGGPFLFGPRLPLYADWQYAEPGFPFRQLGETSRIHWAEGRSLTTGKPTFVPAPLVFIPWRSTTEDEWLGPSTSTGMACETSWAQAALVGLREVIEREAFTLAWMHRASRPRIAVAPESPLGRELAAISARAGGVRVTFVDLTTDLGAPVVLAVAWTRAGGRRLITVGSAAKPTYREAARKALSEAVCDAVRLRDVLAAGKPWEPAADFSDVTDWDKHSLVYLDPARQAALDFLTASPTSVPLEALDPEVHPDEDPDEQLGRLVAAVAARGEEVVVVTLTTRDVAELGLHVVKVFVPGTVPLNPDHRYPWLGHRRLYEVPCALGWRGDRPETADLNPMPHPFA